MLARHQARLKQQHGIENKKMNPSKKIIKAMPIKPMPTQSYRPNYNPHMTLNDIHAGVISIIPVSHLVLLPYSPAVEFQCTSGYWALLPFPSTGADRETHSTWLNSHKLSALSIFLFFFLSFSLTLSQSVHWAGRDWWWRVLAGCDYESAVLLLLRRSLRGVYRSIVTLLKGWADWYF